MLTALIVLAAWFALSLPVAVVIGRALGRASRSLEPARNAPARRWAA